MSGARHERGQETGRLLVSPRAEIHPTADIDHSADVIIGPGAIVCEGVLIFTHNHVPGDVDELTYSPLEIGPGAFIGARSIICAGCRSIGEGAYIGAGAVVTKDVPAHELWASPAAVKIRDL